MAHQEFINTYFVQPLYSETAGYNVYNTIAYAIILAIAVFGIYKLLKKLQIPIDRNFFIATLPYIFLGGLLRALQDAGVLKSILFVAPILYITDFAIAFVILIASFYSAKFLKTEYWKMMSFIGVLIFGGFAYFYRLVYPVPLTQILVLTAIFIIIIYAAAKIAPTILTKLNQWVLSGAMFDASSTVVGVALWGYGEKHVLPSYLFSIFGPWVMIPLKFFVILIALLAIDKYEEDDFFRNFVKFAILTVTLGPGTRNTLRLAMGV